MNIRGCPFGSLNDTLSSGMIIHGFELEGERIMSPAGPTVSIIVPVYNLEKTVARCLDSVINQTYKKNRDNSG